MARKCPYNNEKKCNKKDFPNICRGCEIRRTSGQKLLTKEPITIIRSFNLVDFETKEYTCPFCLCTKPLYAFYIRIKKGYSEKRFECPDCKQIVRRKTLFKVQSVEEFAEWMFDTFQWNRVSFDKFRQRLKEMGISYQFWNHYKKYKEELTSGKTEMEQYEEHLEEQQKEWLQSQKNGEEY